jgi:hypothetical protein
LVATVAAELWWLRRRRGAVDGPSRVTCHCPVTPVHTNRPGAGASGCEREQVWRCQWQPDGVDAGSGRGHSNLKGGRGSATVCGGQAARPGGPHQQTGDYLGSIS